MQISTVGLDLAKNGFQVHGVDEAGNVVIQRQLRRTQMSDFFRKLPPCLIGMEACATAHFGPASLWRLDTRCA
jgi:transposase